MSRNKRHICRISCLVQLGPAKNWQARSEEHVQLRKFTLTYTQAQCTSWTCLGREKIIMRSKFLGRSHCLGMPSHPAWEQLPGTMMRCQCLNQPLLSICPCFSGSLSTHFPSHLLPTHFSQGSTRKLLASRCPQPRPSLSLNNRSIKWGSHDPFPPLRTERVRENVLCITKSSVDTGE